MRKANRRPSTARQPQELFFLFDEHTSFFLLSRLGRKWAFSLASYVFLILPLTKKKDSKTDGPQFSGFALTTSVLYLTVQVHRATRLEQRRAIREQVDQINWLASSAGAYDRRFAPNEDYRNIEDRRAAAQQQPTMKDVLKHRWNQEVELLARKAYESHWEDVRSTAVEGWRAAVRLVKKE